MRPPTPKFLQNLVRRPPLEVAPVLDGRRFIFLCGLHRSGTSILHHLLRAHPEVSGFDKTGVPQDEGQFLQSVYPPAWVYGGPGRYAFHREAHLTEASDLVSDINRDKLLREWGAYHDLDRKVLLEKSPPNLISSRFLQALFPGAGFVFIVRHPIPVACATLQWAKSNVMELIAHWCAAHRILLEDLGRIERATVLRYEDFVQDPAQWLGAICDFVELDRITAQKPVRDYNPDFFVWWEQQKGEPAEALRQIQNLETTLFTRLGYSLTPPYVAEWEGSLNRP